MTNRRSTRAIRVGRVAIGGSAPIAVQSMTNTDTRDVEATVHQIEALLTAGCEVIRLAVPDMESARALHGIRERTYAPLIADIHFNHVLALEALRAGVDGLRLNPGNIGGAARVKEVVEAASERGVPIRIGVNGGSLEKDLLARYGGRPSAEAMVESALRHVAILESVGFRDIKISLKATDVPTTVAAYRLLAPKVDYPFHIGITEAGTRFGGSIKSAVGLGILLAEGIGDTIRVSLTDDPVEEVRAAFEILKALNLRRHGPTLIACPTCGRDELDVISLAKEVEAAIGGVKAPIKIAVMGCVVNGPGEAEQADLGVAGGGRGVSMLYRKGKMIRRVTDRSQLLAAIIEEVKKMSDEHEIVA
ncbi:MAG: flavodoxin-dependent (E)-4-hydroxy-3-methylbut-2-enyl-diphosphate synthase [Deltaproteobacteria bacterium]|nr:flavodoxin-dependent (E)-4-hydroxy-3-methylbut-2-enyl-diphosphate synthase [Deltaproteobacteria bacterium]